MATPPKTAWVSALLAALLVVPTANAGAGGRFSLFDDPADVSLTQRYGERTMRFHFELYRTADRSRWFADERYAAFSETEGTGTFHVYGEFGNGRGTPSYTSAFDLLSPRVNPAARRQSLLGIGWRHPLDSTSSIALSAEYGESTIMSPLRDAAPRDTTDTRAVLSWTGRFGGSWRPSLTGSVFLGDEVAREQAFRHLGRMYYGVALGGELALLQSHTPYVSFRMERNLSSLDEAVAGVRQDYHTLLSAGWKWQVVRNWSVQAEASYGYRGDGLDLFSPERSRLFFGTRFDFR